VDLETRRALIGRYKEGPEIVREALAGIPAQELDYRPAPGEWSPRMVAHHLADSEMTSAIRLRRLLAEAQPVLEGYDEVEFSRHLFYDRPVEASLTVLEAVRRSTAEILERLREDQWERWGTHSESGHYTVETWLEIYAAHAHDHAAQIARAREAARLSAF
jgi:hypothetical protein